MNVRKSFSAMLRDLSTDYYNHMVSFEDFRMKRREILNQVDFHYNDQSSIESDPIEGDEQTQPRSVGHTMSFKIGEKLDNIDDFKYD